MEEDAQPLEVPIIAPIKAKRVETLEREPLRAKFTPEFQAVLMGTPELVRNVAVVGHIHHGKTTLMDMLVEQVRLPFGRAGGGGGRRGRQEGLAGGNGFARWRAGGLGDCRRRQRAGEKKGRVAAWEGDVRLGVCVCARAPADAPRVARRVQAPGEASQVHRHAPGRAGALAAGGGFGKRLERRGTATGGGSAADGTRARLAARGRTLEKHWARLERSRGPPRHAARPREGGRVHVLDV